MTSVAIATATACVKFMQLNLWHAVSRYVLTLANDKFKIPAMSWYVLPRAAQIRHSSSLFDSSTGSDVSLKLMPAAESIKTAIGCNFTIFRDLYSAQSSFKWLLVKETKERTPLRFRIGIDNPLRPTS